MRRITVSSFDAGQKLNRYLMRYLDAAPRSFFYRMLRKKNITLNGKKADGNERLAAGDEICLFLSEETIGKFQSLPTVNERTEKKPIRPAVSGRAEKETEPFSRERKGGEKPVRPSLSGKAEKKPVRPAAGNRMPQILYEDEDVMILNKPAGILSQKAKPEDISLCEILTDYLIREEGLTEEALRTFRPSVCHRLDRNTSGVIAAGKSIRGLSVVTELLRERRADKYYLCLVAAHVTKPARISAYVVKDSRTNQVTVRQSPPGDPVTTEYRPLASGGIPGHPATLLEVRLITGKTHQIRAQLAALGMPAAGDRKYGDESVNRYFREQADVKRQLLHSWRLVFPEDCGELTSIAGKTFTAPLPEDFRRALAVTHIPEPDRNG